MSNFKLFSSAVLLAIICGGPLMSQSYQGGLRGAVSDTGGGAIASAKLTLINESTKVARATLSNDAGGYVFTAVDPATYTLAAEAPGFKRFERRGVIVGTQEFLTIDIALGVGDVTQTVNVTEEVPLMETSNASTGQVVDRQKLIDLPNLGRNPFMMAKIAPNVVQAGDPRFNRMQDQSGSSQISIAGGPVRGNNYLLDGVAITDSTNRAVIIPTLESVQEVKIQANTYDAEMGRTGGGVFNTYLKSGTNDWHGSAFGYTRQGNWLANSFFNNAGGIPRPDIPQVNFGGSFGGPVIIPKVYRGKNRTFFWLGAERYRQRSGLTQLMAVPTAAERTGDFSHSLTRAGALQTMYDPLSSQVSATGAVTRTPFAGNIIPKDRLNPVGLALAGYYPAPMSAAAYHGASDFTGAGVLLDQASQGTAKLDHELTSWWRANISYLHYKSREPSGNLFNSVSAPGATLLYRKVNATQVNNILTPNPTTVVSIRYGFNRFPNYTGTEADGFNPATLGFPASFVSQLMVLKFPNLTMQNFNNMGAGSGSQSIFDSRNFSASVGKFKGRHSVKAGFDYRVLHVDFITYGTAGSFTFSDGFTRRDPNKGNDGTGSDVASLLLGYPASGSASQAQKLFQYARYYAGYLQDDFRISPKLTLNLGLRYEYETGLAGRDNAFIVGFDPTAANPIGQGAKGGVMYAGVNGNPTKCCSPSSRKLGPRAGFAWAANSKTTIRGGYGIFWAPPTYSGLATLGYSQTTDYIGSNDGGVTPANSLSNPFPGGLLKPAGNSLGLLTGIGQTITYIDQHSGSTMVQQFSFDVQRELPRGITVQAGYVGARTRDLILGTGTINIDQLASEYLSLGSALLQSVANPFYGKGGAGVVASQTITRAQLLRPFPEFGAVNKTLSSQNHAKYDSLVVKAQKRLSAGVTFLASWTFSKNMDNSFGATNYYTSSSTTPQNSYDLGSEYGLAIVNTPHSVKGAISYELPFGRAKPFLHGSRWMDEIVGGWQLNAVTLLQSGFPLALTQATNLNSAIGTSVQRPNATGIDPGTAGSVESRLNGYINPAAFTQAPQFTFGTVSRTIGLRGPGTSNWDVSLMKSFRITEAWKGQFRAESLNVLNTPIFNGPNSSYGNANFGKITQQGNFPRYIQLGVRIMF